MILFSFFDNFGMNTYNSYFIKVVFVGDSAVGKTQIFNRYVNDLFKETDVSTVGVNIANKEVNFKNKKIILQLCDTSGQGRFRDMTQNCCSNSKLIFLVYAVDDKNSFDNIQIWVEEVKTQNKDAKFLLVGNKCDLKEKQREVTTEEAKEYAAENKMKFFEVSAKTGKGIENMFKSIISELLKDMEAEEKKEEIQVENHIKDIDINHNNNNNRSFWSKYCSCCPCLKKSEGDVEEQEEIE